MIRTFFDVLEINIAVAMVILVLYFLAGKLRKKYGAGWMKIVWILLAVRLLIPYNVSLPFAEIRLLNIPGFEQEENTGKTEVYEQHERAGSEGIEDISGSIGESAIGSTTSDAAQNRADGAMGVMSMLPGENKVHNSVGNTAQNANQSMQIPDVMTDSGQADRTQAEVKADSLSYSEIMSRIWLVGIVASVLYYAFCYVIFYNKCKKQLSPVTDEKLNKEIPAIQEKLIGKNRIPVYQSENISGPMLIGVFAPKLVIPALRKQWTTTELELILAHELCHYQKKDLWLKLLMTGACCMNWFNPTVYLMKKQFFYDVELSCDGSILLERSGEEREAYARVMLSFAGKPKQASSFSTAMVEDKKRMKKRIDYMMDSGKKKKGILGIAVTCVLALAICTIVSCGYEAEDGEAGATERGGIEAKSIGAESIGADHTDTEHDNTEIVGSIYQTPYETVENDGVTHYVVDEREYSYILELTGRSNNAQRDSYYIVLSNNQGISYEDVDQTFWSSEYPEYIEYCIVERGLVKESPDTQKAVSSGEYLTPVPEISVVADVDWFASYNGEKVQRIPSERGDVYSPTTCNDIIFYKAEQGESLDTIIAKMKKAILEPLTIESQERAFTVTAYDVMEQNEIYKLTPTKELPEGIMEAEWIQEYEWDAASEEAWLLPHLDGYYSYEGTDLVTMSEVLAVEPSLEKDGMVSFMSQGSDGFFYFILMRQGDVYRLQRAERMETWQNFCNEIVTTATAFAEPYTFEVGDVYVEGIYYGNYSQTDKTEMLALCKFKNSVHVAGFERTMAIVFEPDSMDVIAYKNFGVDEAVFHFLPTEGETRILFLGRVIYQGIPTQHTELYAIRDNEWVQIPLEGLGLQEDVLCDITENHVLTVVPWELSEYATEVIMLEEEQVSYSWDENAEQFVRMN